MSQKHPVIAITGSSGAGTSTVKNSFEHIFRREKINVAVIEGDSFHRYDRNAMNKAIAISEKENGHPISHFGPEANEFEKLEALFKEYGKSGSGKTRLYPWKLGREQPGVYARHRATQRRAGCHATVR